MSEPSLRVSSNFALAYATDGRPYVAKDSEPYPQFWLNEHDRVLHFIFGAGEGKTTSVAMAEFYRVTGLPQSQAQDQQLRDAVEDMLAAGVLIDHRQDPSRYTATIVDAYVTHRAFPAGLSAYITRSAPIRRDSRVIDLAGGPGDLAIALARTAEDVSLMELSAAFLAAATRRAAVAGVSLTPVHESCNRLVYRDDEFDVVTVSQALHWLDDVMICRGVCRVLKPGGSFFVVHSSIDVDDFHPFASVLGRRSIFGHKTSAPFTDEVEALRRRLSRLFDAFDTPDVHRIDLARRPDCAERHFVARPAALFTQRRPFGLGYVNSFLTDTHIASIGRDPEAFRRELAERAAGAAADDLLGTQHWAVLQFTRDGTRTADLPNATVPAATGDEPATAVAIEA